MSINSPENLKLFLPAEQEEQIQGIFERLAARGFPRQNQTPHITVTFAKWMQMHVVERAKELLPPLLPCQLSRVGTVIFGTKRKQTIAWLLEAPEELEGAARELSALNPEGRGHRWTPHLTMGLRIPRAQVPDYLAALDEETSPHFRHVIAHRAVFWRPGTGELTELG